MPVVKHKPKVIGIVGSRRRDTDKDFRACVRAFEEVSKNYDDVIVSGGCELGGDRFAEIIAKSRGYTIITHYPKKGNLDKKLASTNPRGAYAKINYERNTKIAEDCDILIALVARDRRGGTEDTVKKALKLRKKVIYA